MTRHLACAALGVVALLAGASAASAVQIEKIFSPSGIAAWLVREQAVPLVSLSFAFHGGSTQDEPGKSGTANLAADLLDEGAGDLDGKTYHERLENNAIELNFQVARDNFHGSLQTLNEHRDEAFDLLRLALSAPRFEAAAVERVRGQMLSSLQRDSTSPNSLASRRWWETAFPGQLTAATAKARRRRWRASLPTTCATMCAAPSRATNCSSRSSATSTPRPPAR